MHLIRHDDKAGFPLQPYRIVTYRSIFFCVEVITGFVVSKTKKIQRLSKIFSAYRSFSSDVTAAILVYQNNEMAAILVCGTGISSFLFKYFVLFHHPTGATDHVSENDLLSKTFQRPLRAIRCRKIAMYKHHFYQVISPVKSHPKMHFFVDICENLASINLFY